MRVLLQHQQQTPHNQQQRRPMSAPLQQGHVPRNPGFQLPQHQPQNIHPQQHPLNPGLNQFQVRGVPYEVMRNHQRMCQINVSGGKVLFLKYILIQTVRPNLFRRLNLYGAFFIDAGSTTGSTLEF